MELNLVFEWGLLNGMYCGEGIDKDENKVNIEKNCNMFHKALKKIDIMKGKWNKKDKMQEVI